MTSRERVILSLNHKEPDMVPIDLGSSHVTGIHIDAYEMLKKYLGIKGYDIQIIDQLQCLAKVEDEVLQALDIDTRSIFPRFRKKELQEDDEKWFFTDEWGVSWVRKKDGGLYFELADHPFKNAEIKDIENFDWPSPDDPYRVKGLRDDARELYEKTDYALVGDVYSGCVMEFIWFQTGLVRFLTDMVLDPEFIKKIIERSLKIQLKIIDNFLKEVGEYLQVLVINGDLGTQQGPLLSPKLYREFLMPYEKSIVQFVKERTKAKIFRHTCGSIYKLIPDILQTGIDVLNPIQVSAENMDPVQLKREFGSQLSFWGGVDSQKILSQGNTDDVTEEVKKRISQLSSGGGYILGSVHNIQPDVKPENIVALYQAARKFGKYQK
ncbi:MAG TPA: uroporphyrinogen-III decarboxylase [Candidatus Atribacteria bacterium]|nr:uroporphyrinogen-III decarboxylase [Candidatus Atribacteria bacterium]